MFDGHQRRIVADVEALRIPAIRYDVVTDPAGLFLFWERARSIPATLDGELLAYETRSEAQRSGDALNAARRKDSGLSAWWKCG
ncbi:hypothetical protein MesoLjLc_15840 [Mesorhizobium sp. L-8-10]|uniref:hypothetical protein n=1 Tax=unclassified Mesorhizobium TaxID=325217 RepID=UPI001926B5D6|nr:MULTISPECIES: hypothetical protein [unclassified Mesorhizobium]BCH21960.1 hypothetical protein MesoLjLb_17450 [Mesorhizobium sp. L-8-3]BCH29654.1 hypothetical protein MesoLjLc_15840 [Mesorhizobium sp. L-8-10]